MKTNILVLFFVMLAGCSKIGQDLLQSASQITGSSIPSSSSSSSPNNALSTEALTYSFLPLTTYTSYPTSMQAALIDVQSSLTTALGGVTAAATIQNEIIANSAIGQAQGARVVNLNVPSLTNVSATSTLVKYVANLGGGNVQLRKWALVVPNSTAPILPNPTTLAQYSSLYGRTGFALYQLPTYSGHQILMAGGTSTLDNSPLGSLVVVSNTALPSLASVSIISNIIASPTIYPPHLSEVGAPLQAYLTNCPTVVPGVQASWPVIGRRDSGGNITGLFFVNPSSWQLAGVITSTTAAPCALSTVLSMGGLNQNQNPGQVTITTQNAFTPPSIAVNTQTQPYTFVVSNSGTTSVQFNSIQFDIGSGWNPSSGGTCNQTQTLAASASCTQKGYFSPYTCGIFGGNLSVQYTNTNSEMLQANFALAGTGTGCAGASPSPSPGASPSPSPLPTASVVLYKTLATEDQSASMLIGTTEVIIAANEHILNGSEATLNVTVKNNGPAAITIADCAGDPSNNAPFLPIDAQGSGTGDLFSNSVRIDAAGSTCAVFPPYNSLFQGGSCTYRVKLGCRATNAFSGTATFPYQTSCAGWGSSTAAQTQSTTFKLCFVPTGGAATSVQRPMHGYIQGYLQ